MLGRVHRHSASVRLFCGLLAVGACTASPTPAPSDEICELDERYGQDQKVYRCGASGSSRTLEQAGSCHTLGVSGLPMGTIPYGYLNPMQLYRMRAETERPVMESR